MLTIKEITDFQQSLIDLATSRGEMDVTFFSEARQSLIAEPSLRSLIPDLIKKNRTPQDFLERIKSQHSTYAGRREEIRSAFDPLLEHLELGSIKTPKTQNQSKAFISYSTLDKSIAGRIKLVLKAYEIESFMAHDDIEVSQEWRQRILSEIQSCGIFICLLSNNFLDSHFCIQETGIASSMENLCAIPLSIDGTTPPGFLSKFQSAKIDPESITIDDLIPAFLERRYERGIDLILKALENSGAYRTAEARVLRIIPHLDQITSEQVDRLVRLCRLNNQIYDASRCANEFFPIMVNKFSGRMDKDTLQFFKQKIDEYS